MRPAENRAWTAQDRAECGIVLSLSNGELSIQRGVQRREAQVTEQDGSETTGKKTCSEAKEGIEAISLPMVTKMSSERTLAVQAALMQQPEKAVALMVWKLCSRVFIGCSTYNDPFSIGVIVSHYSLTLEAPSGKAGAGYVVLIEEMARLEALLPDSWEKDFTSFFALDGALLMSLMAFCTACSVNGVQTRESNRTTRSPLDALETAIVFHLRDWWTPTQANFFNGLKHTQIVDALNEAGCTGPAQDAAKMKKGDAADLAQHQMSLNRWVPSWMSAPQMQVQEQASSDEVRTDTAENTESTPSNPALAA